MQRTIYTTGFWAALLSFASMLAYVFVQILQLLHVLSFPVADRLIYGTSLCIVLPFLVAMLALHYSTAPARQFWSHAALAGAVLYAVFVTANYVVQLATVIPAKLQGTGSEIRVLDQTPHSLFWNFDALGYIFMGLAMLAARPAFARREKIVRRFFMANALMTPVISVVYFYPDFSATLLLFGFPWAVTAPGAMWSLAMVFRQRKRKEIKRIRQQQLEDFYRKSRTPSQAESGPARPL